MKPPPSLTLTAPEEPAAGRPPPKCTTCKLNPAPVPPDERDAYDLPLWLCACGLTLHHAKMHAAGYGMHTLNETHEAMTALSRKAGWRVRYGARDIAPINGKALFKGDPPQRTVVVFGPFVPLPVVAAFNVATEANRATRPKSSQAFVIAPTDLQVATLTAQLRQVTDPDTRAALTAAVRIAGDDVIADALFAPLRDNAGASFDANEAVRVAAADVLRGKA